MKKTHTDPKTGWLVSIEPKKKAPGGTNLTTVSITNPKTGETHTSLRSADALPLNIAEWIKDIARYQEYAERAEIERAAFLHNIYPELATGADLPNGPLPTIKLNFAQTFAHWEISLPEKNVINRQRGKINQAGWAIWYLFDADEKGEYLDYYSAHRMTDDGHVRVYENGESESLDAIAGMRPCSSDPEENAQMKKEQHEEDNRIEAMLEAKGFGIGGDEPTSVQIQRYQRLQKPKK